MAHEHSCVDAVADGAIRPFEALDGRECLLDCLSFTASTDDGSHQRVLGQLLNIVKSESDWVLIVFAICLQHKLIVFNVNLWDQVVIAFEHFLWWCQKVLLFKCHVFRWCLGTVGKLLKQVKLVRAAQVLSLEVFEVW